MHYKHTQFSPLFFSIALVMMSFFGFLYMTEELDYIMITLQVFVIFLLFSFSFLTVLVDNTEFKVKFGYGIYRKRFNLGEIDKVEVVRNKWYYGWGIRYRLKPFTTIFNVAGLDAVEIKTKKGKIFRIGTNEPDKLKEVLLNSIT